MSDRSPAGQSKESDVRCSAVTAAATGYGLPALLLLLQHRGASGSRLHGPAPLWSSALPALHHTHQSPERDGRPDDADL